MQSLIIFALGLSVGSFLSVLIYRLPRGENFVKGRSHCPSCHHVLIWKDLIPLASFIFLKRKCSYCAKKISWRYFGAELLTAVIFLLFFWFDGDPLPRAALGFLEGGTFLLWLAVLSLLIVLIFIDFDYFIIPDKILVVLLLVGFLNLWLSGRPLNLFYSFLTGLAGGLLFFLVYSITKGYYEEGGMGLGDVKLAAVLGLLFGFPAILPVIYLALAGSLVVGLALILFFKGHLKTKLPFGSFLAGAAIFYLLFNRFFLPIFTPYLYKLYL